MLVNDVEKNNDKPGWRRTSNLFMMSRNRKGDFYFLKEISYERNTFT